MNHNSKIMSDVYMRTEWRAKNRINGSESRSNKC